jgi:hypothetical protein
MRGIGDRRLRFERHPGGVLDRLLLGSWTPSEVEMHHALIEEAIVADQLRQEFLARAWAVNAFVAPPDIDVGDPDVAPDVGPAAAQWSRALCSPAADARDRAASALRGLLWPAFSAPHAEWWTTPLGEAIRRASQPRHDGACRSEPELVPPRSAAS